MRINMKFDIQVENIKCGGCANTIRTKIKQQHQLENLEIDVENGTVKFEADKDISTEVASTLKSLGYPESGSVEGFDNIKAKATSFVSCAVGRIQKNET